MAQHKPLVGIEPHFALTKACALQQLTKAIRREFIAILGVNTLALIEPTFTIVKPPHGDITARFQVHFNARLCRIEKTAMLPVFQNKVTAKQTIHMAQHIAIERSSQPQIIVIGSVQQPVVLDQIDPDQEPAMLPQRQTLADPAQKLQGFLRCKITQGGTWIKKQTALMADTRW